MIPWCRSSSTIFSFHGSIYSLWSCHRAMYGLLCSSFSRYESAWELGNRFEEPLVESTPSISR
jgi:hypothetical protein